MYSLHRDCVCLLRWRRDCDRPGSRCGPEQNERTYAPIPRLSRHHTDDPRRGRHPGGSGQCPCRRDCRASIGRSRTGPDHGRENPGPCQRTDKDQPGRTDHRQGGPCDPDRIHGFLRRSPHRSRSAELLGPGQGLLGQHLAVSGSRSRSGPCPQPDEGDRSREGHLVLLWSRRDRQPGHGREGRRPAR